MSHSPRALLSATRPVEALLFELPAQGGSVAAPRARTRLRTAVTVLIDRRSGALAFAGEIPTSDERESEALRQTARGEGPPLIILPMRAALTRVADAVRRAEVLGREVPSWLPWRFGLQPGVRPLAELRCYVCDRAVESERARPDGTTARCRACLVGVDAYGAQVESALGRAWLLLSAGLPGRALRTCTTAVEEGAPVADVNAVRGVAHLAMGDATRAIGQLTEALYLRPGDLRWQGWLQAAIELGSGAAGGARPSARSPVTGVTG